MPCGSGKTLVGYEICKTLIMQKMKQVALERHRAKQAGGGSSSSSSSSSAATA